MNSSDTHNPNGETPTLVENNGASEVVEGKPSSSSPKAFATRTKGEMKDQLVRNKGILGAGAALAVAFALFLISPSSHKKLVPDTNRLTKEHQAGASQTKENPDVAKSAVPVIDAGNRSETRDSQEGTIKEHDLEATVRRDGQAANQPQPKILPAGTLGLIPPFSGDNQSWQAPPYQGSGGNSEAAEETVKKEQDRASLVFVQKAPQSSNNAAEMAALDSVPGLGLVTGSRLRARLETAASTAVKTPVIAVIEYNYEKNGEILVPAGAKVFGHIEQADRSGYLSIRFDSLLMPDGSLSTLDAVATDLGLKPLKGKVEGKNSGKNALVRSLSGIGQVGALLAGRGNSLNSPFSEGDLVRERLSNNIGQSADQELAQLTVAEHIVVSIPANTPLYVVLDRGSKESLTRTDQLRRGRPRRRRMSSLCASFSNCRRIKPDAPDQRALSTHPLGCCARTRRFNSPGLLKVWGNDTQQFFWVVRRNIN